MAHKVIAEQGILAGLVCVLVAVELCASFDILPNQATNGSSLRGQRCCLGVLTP